MKVELNGLTFIERLVPQKNADGSLTFIGTEETAYTLQMKDKTLSITAEPVTDSEEKSIFDEIFGKGE